MCIRDSLTSVGNARTTGAQGSRAPLIVALPGSLMSSSVSDRLVKILRTVVLSQEIGFTMRSVLITKSIRHLNRNQTHKYGIGAVPVIPVIPRNDDSDERHVRDEQKKNASNALAGENACMEGWVFDSWRRVEPLNIADDVSS